MKEHISQVGERKIVKVPVEKISELNLNPRKNGLIEANVESLVESGGEFPPIHLAYYQTNLIVVDGYHRLEATKRLELPTIDAWITEYTSEDKLTLDAINENVVHGVRLGDYDIAMNLYDLYKKITSKKTLNSLADFLKNFKIPERRGKQLLLWSILHKEVLEDSVEVIEKESLAEEMLTAFAKKLNFDFLIGSIPEEHKVVIKKFFEKYCDSSREVLREALRAMREGREIDKDDIKAKIEEKKEALKEAEKLVAEQSSTPAMSEDTNKTSSVIEDKSYEAGESSNSTIQKLLGEKEEIIEETIEEVTKTKEPQKVETVEDMLAINISNLEMSIMKLKMYQNKKINMFTKEILDKLVKLQDVFQEVIDETNQHLVGQIDDI